MLICNHPVDGRMNGRSIEIAEGVFRMGADDRTEPIFEGSIPIPEGVSYNSYLILDEKACLLDTCDASVLPEFWDMLGAALGGRRLDYFVIDHMEPDHGAGIVKVLESFPDAVLVTNKRVYDMLWNFYGLKPSNWKEVKDGDELPLGRRTLKFVFAPNVHWPEVMMAYEVSGRILFSADAFGCFKTLDGKVYADEADFDMDYLDEARRYYTNIVGKYGQNVQNLFKKVEGVPIDMLCPLHGFVWRSDLGYILGKYDVWSRYDVEEKGVVIACASMYGNTVKAAEELAGILRDAGVKTVLHDLRTVHPTYVVSDAFRFGNIVLASPTYNNTIPPGMASALEDMATMAVQNRRYSLIGNGSWGPASHKVMEERVSAMKNMVRVGEPLVFKSCLKDDQKGELRKLADDIIASI